MAAIKACARRVKDLHATAHKEACVLFCMRLNVTRSGTCKTDRNAAVLLLSLDVVAKAVIAAQAAQIYQALQYSELST